MQLLQICMYWLLLVKEKRIQGREKQPTKRRHQRVKEKGAGEFLFPLLFFNLEIAKHNSQLYQVWMKEAGKDAEGENGNKKKDTRTDLPPVSGSAGVWSERPSEPRCPPHPADRLHERRTPP